MAFPAPMMYPPVSMAKDKVVVEGPAITKLLKSRRSLKEKSISHLGQAYSKHSRIHLNHLWPRGTNKAKPQAAQLRLFFGYLSGLTPNNLNQQVLFFSYNNEKNYLGRPGIEPGYSSSARDCAFHQIIELILILQLL